MIDSIHTEYMIQTTDSSVCPEHVAIIPDGNRRWAQKQNLDPWIGHAEGAARLEEILEYACERGITYLSVWGSSQANLEKRPLREKKELLAVYEEYFTKLLESDVVSRERVCVSVIGLWRTYLPQPMIELIERVQERTRQHDGKYLTVMIAYSGDEEMLSAINALVKEGGPVDHARLKSKLMTHALPPVDLMIRTGGEPHMSAGFMMWDLADAEYYFTEVLFPDFDREVFAEALEEFASRGRRKGA